MATVGVVSVVLVGLWQGILGFHGRIFRVYEGKALELFLVEVHDDLLVWGGEDWRMTCEKTIKVLCIPATLQEGERRKTQEKHVMDGGRKNVEWGGGENRTETCGEHSWVVNMRELMEVRSVNTKPHKQTETSSMRAPERLH